MSPWGCVALIVIAPQIMGGALDWSVPLIAGLSFCALLFAVAPHNLRGVGVPWGVWVASAATLWTCAQLVPLGSALSAGLATERAVVQRGLAAALGYLPLSATAISMDPGATQLEVMKGCGLLCAFTACYIMARRGYATELSAAIAGSGTLMALVALFHRAIDAKQVFGVYAWRHAAPRLPAPILNDNCLAGFLVLTVPVALGLALTSADARMRLVQYLSAFVVAGTGLLTGSRAGTGAMVFALVATALLARGRRRAEARSLAGGVTAAIVVAGAIAVAAVVGAEPLLKTLSSDDFSKFDFVIDGLRRGTQQPWVGVGRGAFSAAMTATMDDGGRFVHAENFLVTWLSEWGFPLGAAVVLWVGSAVFRLLTGRSRLRAAMGIGLLAFGAQNLLDLGLELAGIATVAAASLGTGLGAADHERPSQVSPWGELRWACWGIAAVTLLTLALFAPAAIADGDGTSLRRLELAAQQQDPRPFREAVGRVLARHPFEPVVYLIAGRNHAERGELGALRWLNLAMLRAPLWSAPHVEAARLLGSRGLAGQAALEAREATSRNPAAGAAAVCAAVRGGPRVEQVISAALGAKTPTQRRTFYFGVTRCLDAQTARQLDQHMIGHASDVAGPYLREGQRVASGGGSSSHLDILAAGIAATRGDPMLMIARARALLHAGRPKEAADQLAQATEGTDRPDVVAALAAEIAAGAGDTAGMRLQIERLRALGAGSGARLATASMLRARLEALLGHEAEAEQALNEGLELEPSVANIRTALAFAKRRGQTAKAARLRGILCATAPAASDCP